MDSFPFHVRASQANRKKRTLGFTLIEAMVSLAVLGLVGVGSVSGFMLLNRYASDNGYRNAARVLCQERIEQALTLPFRPYVNAANLTKLLPTVYAQDNTTINLLGQASDYNDAGAYQSGAQQTSNESVTISALPNGSQTALAPVTGTRTTKLEVANATYSIMRVTVTVTWTLRGQTNSYTLYALRATD